MILQYTNNNMIFLQINQLVINIIFIEKVLQKKIRKPVNNKNFVHIQGNSNFMINKKKFNK